jgi:hypothetical protein
MIAAEARPVPGRAQCSGARAAAALRRSFDQRAELRAVERDEVPVALRRVDTMYPPSTARQSQPSGLPVARHGGQATGS